jgi:quinoprotein dehydrogenase-associated probable ABC transporter substrate-binding protein
MFSLCRKLTLLLTLVPLALIAADDCCPSVEASGVTTVKPLGQVLRITADPNNLPFSNERREGFENKIAEIIAQELGVKIEWSWRAQRRGFFRETLKDNNADLVLGAPAGYERALTTAPYYRSTYVFVYRKDRALDLKSLDDPRLRELKIGVQIVGDDGVNTPPAHALARRGIVNNLVGFTLYGDYTEPNPPARIIDAVAKGDVDVAIVWGPLAGYFAKQATTPMQVVPVTPEVDPPGLRFAFSIAMGVRRKDPELKEKIDNILTRRRADVDKILEDYGVPRLALAQPKEAEHQP